MNVYRPQLDWIDSQRDVMRDRVITWCDINSYTFNLPGIARVGEEVEHVLRTFGAQIEWIDLPPAESIDSRADDASTAGKGAACPEKAGCPEADFPWHSPRHGLSPRPAFPIGRTIDANTLNGPGVIDAKGGLVVMLTALAALERSDLANQIGWEVLLNPDEEIGSPGSADLLIESARRNQIGLVFEPAIGNGNLVDSRKGSGNFMIVVHGKAAHAGRDFNAGRNAIVALSEIVTKLHALNDTLPGMIINVGKIDGGGAVNVVPDLAIARINVRTTLPEDESKLRERFNQILSDANQRDGIRATLHGGLSSPPKPLDPKSRTLLDHILTCGHELGLNLSSQPSGGTSDGNKLAAAGLPVIDSLGPRGGKLHSPEEFLYRRFTCPNVPS